MEKERFDVTGGSGIVGIFKNESYKLERVISEFIDNSLQSYIDNKEVLSRLPDGKCKVDITWVDDKIVIKDNAFGMDKDGLARALKPRSKNPRAQESNRLSIFGMGVNYATAYLCHCYTIETSQYGSTEKRRVTVDIDELEANNPEEIESDLVDEEKYEHYTTITFKRLRVKLTSKSEDNLRKKLGLIFKGYIDNGSLVINFNGVPVSFEYPPIRKDEQGDKYLRNFRDTFSANGKLYEYNGWVAILETGDQSITGFNLKQAQRCIEVAYSPKALFGSGNSFQNSRIIGEIFLEDIELSFSKDKFVWQNDGVEEAFIESLRANEKIRYILKTCEGLRKEEDNNKITKKTFDNLKKTGLAISTTLQESPKPKKNKVVKTERTIPSVVSPEPAQVSKISVEPYSTINAAHTICETAIEDKNKNLTDRRKNEVAKPTEETNNLPWLCIDVDGTQITMMIDSFAGAEDEDWISLKQIGENIWNVRFNTKNKLISMNFPKENGKAGANFLGVSLVTAILRSKSHGLKLSDGNTLLRLLNQVLGSKNG